MQNQNAKLSQIFIRLSAALLIIALLTIFLFLINTEKLDLEDYLGNIVFLLVISGIIIVIINLIFYVLFSIMFYFLRINYTFALLLKNLVISIIITSFGSLYLLILNSACIGEDALGCAIISFISLLLASLFILIFTICNIFKLRKNLKSQ